MKIVKKTIFCLLCLALSIQFVPISAFASQSLDEKLVERNYPISLIESMCEEEKIDLINEDCYFESSKTYNYDDNGRIINTQEITESNNLNAVENGVATCGQIKSSHLSLKITSSKTKSGNTVITFNYEWLQPPLNRFQDPMCVSWDDSIFTYKSGSFKKVDKYVKIYNGPEFTHSSEASYAKADSNYISWYADIPGYTKNATGIYGYGKFTLKPKPKKSKKSTMVYGHYVHAKAAGSISVTYKKAEFSVSGISQYDELGTDLSLKS